MEVNRHGAADQDKRTNCSNDRSHQFYAICSLGEGDDYKDVIGGETRKYVFETVARRLTGELYNTVAWI